MSRRLLPEAAYDFWAYDSRDGEQGFIRDTLAEARADVALMRKNVTWSWQRGCWQVRWRVNERKVLAMLHQRPEQEKKT